MMQYRNIFSASRPKLMSPPKGLMTFPLKFRKIVAAKMRQSGRPENIILKQCIESKVQLNFNFFYVVDYFRNFTSSTAFKCIIRSPKF